MRGGEKYYSDLIATCEAFLKDMMHMNDYTVISEYDLKQLKADYQCDEQLIKQFEDTNISEARIDDKITWFNSFKYFDSYGVLNDMDCENCKIYSVNEINRCCNNSRSVNLAIRVFFGIHKEDIENSRKKSIFSEI